MTSENKQGFTIVELLIVIVVIGILAAITIVAYNGVQQRARVATISTDLSGANKLLAFHEADKGVYPATLDETNNNQGIKASSGTTYQYTSTGSTYCLTATNGTTSYKVGSSATAPTAGACAGHGAGGVAAITNIVPNPKGVSPSSTGWFRPLVGTDMSVASNVSWNSRSDWNRLAFNGTGNATARLRLPLASLTNGSTYTVSVLLGNSGASAITANFDFCDQGATAFVLQAGEMRRVSFSASRSTYDAVYSFVDLAPSTNAATGILATEAIVTLGTAGYNYADGDTTNWVWNGTAHNATSTGSPV